ncbi:uncharacterized protein LOC114534359 [Dendronephthya gigantea]|uniref:uncharacterized protein LOC114534359 n=1 Tax=Dendronephthya gigantea TaxID=151771 RepID=UPI00106D6B72|nr:uncharacterized protein LOC114534359 [Dendronephthya gigantea]
MVKQQQHQRGKCNNGYPQLVGNAGKISKVGRLHPIKTSKKYREFLEAAENERNLKICEMSRLIESYWELRELLLSVEQANENNCNSFLIKELENKKLTIREKLIYLESSVDQPLPLTIDGSMKKILNRASSKPQMRKESSKRTSSFKKYCPNPMNITEESHETAILRDGPNINDVPKSAPDIRNRNSWRASVKSQIFVRINNLQVITINIDLFTCADNLQRVLTQELGEKAEDYNITFGSKELDKDKTLFEQKIYHGTTVDLHVRLHGGKGKKRTKKKLNQQKKKDDNITVTHEDNANKSSPLTLGSMKVEDIEEDVDKESEHELLQASRNDISGTFGKLPNLDSIRGLLILEDISNDGKSPTPEFGSVVSVKGICERKESFGNNTTLIIRDDPQGASSISYKMKIVIRSNEKSMNLKINNIEKLLGDVRKEVQVAVMGRVERLESESNDTKDPHCEMIRFQLVVDSDNHHGFVYVERIRPKYTRQLSQPWWISENGDSSSQFLNLKKGDRIAKTAQRIFLESTASKNEILNYVVALKNCRDGDIFVGVDVDGVVTGIKSDDGKIAKMREELSIAITSILPESNEGTNICFTLEEACNYANENKCFVCVLPLSTSGKSEMDEHYISWIHVPQGETEPLYFRAEKNVHAYIRKGAEKKLIRNYKEFFSSLYSLGSRPKPKEVSEEDLDIEIKFKESIGKTGLSNNYQVLQKIRYESQNSEFKMIPGCDPVKTIVDKHLRKYACGFLNASGGTILFGVQEEKESKVGHVVGMVISLQKKKELVQKAVTVLSEFYPPVLKSQFRLIFHKVIVPPQFVSVVKNEQPNKDGTDSFLLLQGPPDKVFEKWPKFVKDKFQDCLSRVIPLKPKPNCEDQNFCIVVENRRKSTFDSIFENNLNGFLKENEKITRNSITEDELNHYLNQLCIIELKIFPSQYPIHLTRSVETHVFDKQGNLVELSIESLMNRFKFGNDSKTTFEVDKFLEDVEDFKQAGNSYILITSPFLLPTSERDLHGLVLPQWTLVVDFDQHLKKEGHLYSRFKELYDVLHIQRRSFIKTPRDTKLDLDPEHAICWLAVRGYDEVEKTLSQEGHANWITTHRSSLASLLKPEIARCVQPNYLRIIVLWDEGQEPLIYSLRTILEDIISFNGHRTAVTFVCSTEAARSEINENLVLPLQKIGDSYWRIFSIDRVYIAQPYVLSRHLSANLPSPYQPEDDYQVPHRKKVKGKYQTWPDILPTSLRNNNCLKVMYIRKKKELEKRKLEKEREKFYCGLKITDIGLQNEFGIEREKMKKLETDFELVCTDLNNRRGHVAILCLKVDRGAGSSTLCLQFLFKHHKEYPCAQLLEIGEDLLSYIREINNATQLPLLLFVDEEISHPQDFLDFSRKLVECSNVNVILLIIEPAEAKKSTNNTRIRNIEDLSTLQKCLLKVIELRRDLTNGEMTDLTNNLADIKKDKKISEKLATLKGKAAREKRVLTFAHFGLTVFGKDFFGLYEFVKFRLDNADDKQKTVLSYLSLIHVYTDSTLPASALSGFLETKEKVNLENEFQDDYVRELLSPPVDNTDSRRISFHEVAEEILAQLASVKSCGSASKQTYWQFIKDVAVDLAKQVLSVNITNKTIDRLTRRLFVTSEYESEKFSSLIRAMKDNDRDTDIARDTLTELIMKDIFQKPSSFRAHILAHLAKYYMIVAKDFEQAKPRIEEAIKDQPDDPLLRHIHGDIILRHLKAIKKRPDIVDMDTIVSLAEESSNSFKFVRRKQPDDSHGYRSDAMVRITVMQAATKHQAGTLHGNKKICDNFIDFLLETLNVIRERGDRIITRRERYLISLIPKAHEFLYEGVSDDYDHKEKWKVQFRKHVGDLSNLNTLCDKIRKIKSIFPDIRDKNSTWLHKVLINIQRLKNGFEIDEENLTEKQIEERINRPIRRSPSETGAQLGKKSLQNLVSSEKSSLSHARVVGTSLTKPGGIAESLDIFICARAVSWHNTNECDMQCPKPLNRKITEAEPVSCLSAMASAMLLGVGFLPPDAKFRRSCTINVSLALFLPSIGTYSLKVGSEENPQVQAETLKSSHGTTFCTLSIVKSDANGGQRRFSFVPRGVQRNPFSKHLLDAHPTAYKEIDEAAKGLKYPESVMMFWIRYSRRIKNVPHLEDVRRKVKDWLFFARKRDKPSPNAEFYNYVVNMLIALQDPNDAQKREKVAKIPLEKKHKKDNVTIPQEWLDPKDGHHINSINSLLHHDDLVKEKDENHRNKQQRRGVVEGYLSKKDGKGVTRWKGTVFDVQKLWFGIIIFKKHFEVRFIPQNVQGSARSGDTVSFCLGFDRLGLSAWWVRLEERGSEPLEGVRTFPNFNGHDSSSDKEEENASEDTTRSSSCNNRDNFYPRENAWDSRIGERLQGVVVFTNSEKGFGSLKHPDIKDTLFFHASQLDQPVVELEGNIEKHMVLDFIVEKSKSIKEGSTGEICASDIHVVVEKDIDPKITTFLKRRSENDSSPSVVRHHRELGRETRMVEQSKETGVFVKHSNDGTYGFIKPDRASFGRDIFFHREGLVSGESMPNVGKRVQFSVFETKKGFKATQVCEGIEDHPRKGESLEVWFKE